MTDTCAAAQDRAPVPVDAIPAALAAAVQSCGQNHGQKVAGWLRVTIPIATQVSPLDWLANQPCTLRFFGSTREAQAGLEIAGVGEATTEMWPPLKTEAVDAQAHNRALYREVFDHLQSKLDQSSDGVRFYGGFRFAPHRVADVQWEPFGQARFIIPRFELVRTPAKTILAFHFSPTEWQAGEACAMARAFNPDTLKPYAWQAPMPVPLGRYEVPDYSRWETCVADALADFDAQRLDKVVLARKAYFTFEEELDPIHLLHRLKRATPDCFHFCFMPTPEQALVGASPERLYRRRDLALQTEAVAGTRMRHADATRDRALAEDLQSHDKDRREHEWVRQGIVEALATCCASVEMDPVPTILKLARGQHLYSACNAILKPGTGDAELMAALHPTPALGGYPTGPADECIAALESFDRGWYAGPVGWLARDQAEFAVAIRVGLVEPRKLSLFSGAGIVSGSTPEAEWDEIELKIRDFIKVLTRTS